MSATRARSLRWGVLVFSLAAAYLFVHYTVVLLVGPERLFSLLGEEMYNALIPAGGIPILLFFLFLAGAWLLPFGFSYLLTFTVLRNARRVRRRLASLILATSVTLSLPLFMLDGWPWALLPVFFEDDTEFARGYSAVGFWLVRYGAQMDQVIERVGPPLERYPINGPSQEEGWRWTRTPNDGSYRVRTVVFRDGRVVKKHSEFYID